MNPCELTLMITAAANALAENLTDEELSILSAFLTQLGDTLMTIYTQRELCRARCVSGNDKA